MIRSGHRRFTRSFNLCYRYIDDLIVLITKKFLNYLKEIYPSQLTVEKANKSDHLANYLDITFMIENGSKRSTRIYDKRDDFDFHIVIFPFLSRSIPFRHSYGVYILQFIRYARCCSHCDDFRYHQKCLVDRLLSQGYISLRCEKSFKKFNGRYQYLIEKYQRSVKEMVNDSFSGQPSLFFYIFHGDVTQICQYFYLIASCDRVMHVMHEADETQSEASCRRPISHTSTQYMDFVDIFNIVLDSSTIYFSHFSGC